MFIRVSLLLLLLGSVTASQEQPESEDKAEKHVDLFLMGKTGHGKSSTGNTIIGREVFETSDSSDSETYYVDVAWARRFGRVLKVVDGPGLHETRLSREEGVKKMLQDMSQAIAQCPKGFHAMLIVLKYSNRFTEEEFRSIEILKTVFGQDFVKEFVIVVFTHGDLFELNNKKHPGRTFQDWLKDQKGPMSMLLKECNYRAALFSNMSPGVQEQQILDLLKLVDALQSKGKRYTSDLFDEVATSREQFIVRENAPQLREYIQEKIDLLMDGVRKVKEETRLTEDVGNKLDTLIGDLRVLDAEITLRDKGTGVLDSLKQVVSSSYESVQSHKEALKQKLTAERAEKIAEAKIQYALRLRELEAERAKSHRNGVLENFFRIVYDAVLGFYNTGRAILKFEL